jgi:D-glycero-alpha-D-manno-heptose-7-phosphate kinase
VTVIARAPLRIGLAGGGTDLPSYADRYGGVVISTSIDRYVYVIVNPAPDDVLQITAADANTVVSRHDHLFDSSLIWGADYRLSHEILDYFSITRGRRYFISSEVPPGTGLGSSSSTAVAMIKAISIDRGLALSTQSIADIACHIEIDRMGMPIGRQDQFAAAFGGLNRIEFSRYGTTVEPLMVDDHIRCAIADRVMLFFTGRRRRSTDILNKQNDATSQSGSTTLRALHEIKALAEEMQTAIVNGDLDTIGHVLDAAWQHKRRLAPGVSTPEIDGWYDAARGAGALGGKITGAGGGGFLMLYAHPALRSDVIQQMTDLGLVWVDTTFETEGASAVLPLERPMLISAG